jgi:hypothetical protein
MVQGRIDAITVLASGHDIDSIAAGEVVDVRGWLVPPQASAEIEVDGHVRYPLTIGDPRPDVAAALRDPAAQFAGYRALVPTSDLETGRHEIALVARDDDGAESALAVRVFDVRVAVPVTDGDPVPGLADRYLDEAGAEHEIEGQTVQVAAAEVVTIRGWAVDDVSLKPAQGAVALVGEHVVPTVYGFERFDVVPTIGDAALRFCGFSASFPGSYVAKDGTTFKVALLTGGERGFVPTRVDLMLRAR